MSTDEMLGDERFFRKAVGLFLALSLGGRLWLSAHFFGFLTGDDVEILESGLRWVRQLSYVPWAIRNTLLPTLLVAPMGMLGKGLGIDSPMVLAWLSTVPFAVLSTVNIALTYRLILAVGGEKSAARLGSLLLGIHWLAVGYGSTVYPRTAATTCILVAALWTARSPQTTAARLGAGALVALAFSFRYSEVIFLLPLIWLASREGSPGKRLLSAAVAGGGFVLGCLLFVGLPDLVEWGAPFASLRAFFEYTLVERKASALVVNQPVYWYLWRAHRWIPPAAVVGLWYFRRARVPGTLTIFVVAPLVVLSLIHHKEVRYLQGILPFACAIAGICLAGCWRDGWRRAVVALLVLTVGWSVVNIRFLEKKSMAAVEAARYLAASRTGYRRIALQQPWAYGDQLILPAATGVKELGIDLRAESIAREVDGMEAVALYSDLVTAGISDALARAGYCPDRRFGWGRSRQVSIFVACPQPG